MKPKILFLLLLFFGSVIFAFGQDSNKKISITGVVVDPYKRPVPGAEIIIDGVQSGKSTDKKGFYKIKIKSTAERIGILTLPPATIQERINGRTTINFTLNDSITQQIYRKKNLQGEEMVNVGYGSQKRKSLTTSVGQVDGTENKYASYNSIYDMLRGEIPGVEVVGHSITIRGASTATMNTEPLFVVDGTPVMSIENILPQEVKSIDVLKGSAASIYGTRGTNGVILITLKH
jgi:TonB-dependent SusC/RagA subfamily outer membrane receptor